MNFSIGHLNVGPDFPGLSITCKSASQPKNAAASWISELMVLRPPVREMSRCLFFVLLRLEYHPPDAFGHLIAFHLRCPVVGPIHLPDAQLWSACCRQQPIPVMQFANCLVNAPAPGGDSPDLLYRCNGKFLTERIKPIPKGMMSIQVQKLRVGKSKQLGDDLPGCAHCGYDYVWHDKNNDE